MTSIITFFVNGAEVTVNDANPELTLSSFLREKLNLTGTKAACEEGACGACTVAVGRWNYEKKKADFVSANACITPLYLVDGCLVLTVEGIGSSTSRLHAVQERISRGHGTQCGFCSPGFVMSAYALLRNYPEPTLDQIRTALVGNLCRCTGYRPIIEAISSFGKTEKNGCCMGGTGRCPCKEDKKNIIANIKDTSETKCGLVNFDSFAPYDTTQEIIFPHKLILGSPSRDSLELLGNRVRLLAPSTLEVLSMTVKQLPKVDKIVTTGMMTRLVHGMQPSSYAKAVWIATYRIESLCSVEVNEKEIIVGSGLSIRDLLSAISENCETEDYRLPIESLYKKYSSDQVKNMASWAGALASASPTSDLCTLTLAANWSVRLFDARQETYRSLPADEFFTGAKTCLRSDDVIISLVIPRKPNAALSTFKHGKRLGGDDSVLNCATLYDKDKKSIRVAMGVYKKTKLMINSAKFILNEKASSLKGQPLFELINDHLKSDLEEFSQMKDYDYKMKMARAAVVQRVFLRAIDELLKPKGTYESGLIFEESKFEPLQFYKPAKGDMEPVGRPVAHLSGDKHTTGEAQYVNDLRIHDVKHAGLVVSRVAHGKILSVDPSAALAVNGVIDYVDIKDIPKNGTNTPGLVPGFLYDTTPVFAAGLVEMMGQTIGCVIAEDVETARRAAKLVDVKYEELPAILTIEEAIEKKSFLKEEPTVAGKTTEEIEAELKKCSKIASGRLAIGGQEHFYMETQSSIVVPEEEGEWTIFSSTQRPSDAQYHSAAILGVPASNVVIKVKRLGGGFGGKCTGDGYARHPALVAASKIKKPVSCVLHRYDDVAITGKRHPVLADYRVGFDESGRVHAVHTTVYQNGGFSTDHSLCVIWLLSNTADSYFSIPNIRCEGYSMKTNTCSNTAFRGYGRPQAFFIMEAIMNHVADATGKTVNEIKELNMATEGHVCLLGWKLRNDCLMECWSEVKEMAQFEKQQKEFEEFNKTSKRVKRGIAISGARHGIIHPDFMSQGTALVQLLFDGTVRINVGTVEMGQGLNTKICQVAAKALDIPLERVKILEMATDKIMNTFESGASVGTDICGTAVKKACERLLKDIRPLLDEFNGDWSKALHKAFDERIATQAIEHVPLDLAKTSNPEAPYYTTGAGCVAVEVNCLTGEHKVLSVDIVMDVGDSLNPAVDIGQIEGGFMQGYGLMTSEELEYDEKGRLLTNSAYTYKIPTVHMVPEKFRVKLLENGRNSEGQLYRSKGIGEPPLLLGIASHTAIREAIKAYRRQEGASSTPILDAPLMAKRILNACSELK